MCRRFITTGTWAEYRRYMNILPPEVEKRNGPVPNYNVAPTSELEIVTRNDDANIVQPVHWGPGPVDIQDCGVDLVYYPVARDVGSVQNKSPNLINPVA
jgi:putative SOS response-associated peptidase YedK